MVSSADTVRRFPSEPKARSGDAAPRVQPFARLQRSTGLARIVFKARGGRTVLDDVFQSGCCKVRFPRAEPGANTEAVLINTAGGLTDADRMAVEARWRPGTCAVVTSQAAERIYRSRGEPAQVTNRLNVAGSATALWLPQETILFDGGRMSRRMTATVEEGGQLLACESLVFGRRAMGETVRRGAVRDAWRIRYADRLVFADGLELDGDIETMLARSAIANGSAAFASVLYIGPAAEAMLEPLRSITATLGSTAGCSCIGPVLNLRILGDGSASLRRDLMAVLGGVLSLLDYGDGKSKLKPAARLPRVWTC